MISECAKAGFQALRAPLAAGLTVTVLVGAAVAGPFENATLAYDRGDYATAMRIIGPLAEQDDATAQYNLGNLYYNGRGVN